MSGDKLEKVGGETRTDIPNPCVCKIDLTNVASMAWIATARCTAYRAPDARVASLFKAKGGATATASHRVRTTTYPAGSAPRAPRTRARDALPHVGGSAKPSAINDWRRCPRGPRDHAASSIGSGRSPRTLATKPTRLEAAPSTKQRLPKPTPSPRRRDTDHDKRWTARRRPR